MKSQLLKCGTMYCGRYLLPLTVWIGLLPLNYLNSIHHLLSNYNSFTTLNVRYTAALQPNVPVLLTAINWTMVITTYQSQPPCATTPRTQAVLNGSQHGISTVRTSETQPTLLPDVTHQTSQAYTKGMVTVVT
jgi:hypothetical protein